MKALVLLMLVAAANARVLSRCDAARLFKAGGLDGYRGYSLANWLCLASWESNYNTKATHHHHDGITDYGIFQINSRWWCQKNKRHHAANICGINCKKLLSDNLDAAIKCAKRVVQEPNGMAAWPYWRFNCRGQDLSKYVEDCGV